MKIQKISLIFRATKHTEKVFENVHQGLEDMEHADEK